MMAIRLAGGFYNSRRGKLVQPGAEFVLFSGECVTIGLRAHERHSVLPTTGQWEYMGKINAWMPPRMTYEEFLHWADEDTLAEWVDGEIEMLSPASSRHQQIVLLPSRLLASFLDVKPLGSVYMAPFQMKLAHSGREPDVLFVKTEHLDRIQKTNLDGPADLVVEVVSPESMTRDRGAKFAEYEQAGIPEYWVIDPEAERVEFYQLNSRAHYDPVRPDANGVYTSAIVPGLWLSVEWLWQSPLPPVEDALIDVLGDEYVQHQLQRFRRKGLLP